jgi:hypothetical protein
MIDQGWAMGRELGEEIVVTIIPAPAKRAAKSVTPAS